MKYINLCLMSAFVLILASCSTPQTKSEPPKPVIYEYEYEIINTRAVCEPDFQTWTRLYTAFAYPELVSDKSDKDKAYAEGAKIVECTAGILQSNISQRGADGWKLITFEALQPGTYDLGVEYSYRLVWERPKATP